jgi:hypothetical protein
MQNKQNPVKLTDGSLIKFLYHPDCDKGIVMGVHNRKCRIKDRLDEPNK